MDAKYSTNRKFNRVFVNILSIFAILAIALANTGSLVHAAQNPSASNWDGSAVLKPSVLHEASGYKLWYDGVGFDGNTQVGLAKSKDGTTWKKYPENPVLDGEPDAWDASGEHAAFVMKEGNLYKMWYEGFNGSVRQLGYATSPDGITWTKYPGNPILQAGPEGHDRIVAGHGSVLHDDGLYKLWYHAIGDQGAIIAYATSLDGVNWTKQGPVLLPEDWENALWGPSVLKINGTYWMWYSACCTDSPASINVATSIDGLGWTRAAENPVVTGFMGDPHVIYDGGLFKMWYGNFGDGAIYHAESADGIYWTDPVLALFPAVSTQAGNASPFVGSWQATDVDGSDMSLAIGGQSSGPFKITWTDNYISLCNGGAGIVRGTGWLNEVNSNLLEADVLLECFTTGETLPFHVTFRYHPGTSTLSIIWSFEQGLVTIWYRPGKPQAAFPTLNLRVNYGHDWVESFYEGGHMVSVMVTDGGGNVKAIAEALTAPRDEWEGEEGFQTQSSDWFDADGNQMGNPPDIQPYDWVYGWVDNGASAQVQIGDISGTIDLEADSIEGTIYAPWFSDQQVEVECLPWGAPKPIDNVTYGMVIPDGDAAYSCSWSGEWNILPYQDVGVGYVGPDGHWVANAFHASAPQIIASESGNWFWTTGFNPGTLDLFIYESEFGGEGVNLLWSGQQEADPWGFTIVGYEVHGQDLAPGNYLVISDGVNQKGLVLQPISVTFFDTKYDFMAGIAPLGSEVWAAAGPQEWQQRIFVEADLLTGEWLADFAAIGFDITEEMQPWSYSHIYDGDGDANEGGVPPLELWAAVFTHDAPDWTTSGHNYYFDNTYTFPASGGEVTDPFWFTSADDAVQYDGYVMLRPLALRARVNGECPAIDPPTLNPSQPTRFVYGWVTDYPMTYEEALAHFDSMTVKASWDGGEPAVLTRHEIIPFGSVDWAQYVCTFTE